MNLCESIFRICPLSFFLTIFVCNLYQHQASGQIFEGSYVCENITQNFISNLPLKKVVQFAESQIFYNPKRPEEVKLIVKRSQRKISPKNGKVINTVTGEMAFTLKSLNADKLGKDKLWVKSNRGNLVALVSNNLRSDILTFELFSDSNFENNLEEIDLQTALKSLGYFGVVKQSIENNLNSLCAQELLQDSQFSYFPEFIDAGDLPELIDAGGSCGNC